MPADTRAPAKHRAIDDIDPREDIRVSIVCTVLEVAEESIMVDDGSGTTEVFVGEDQLDGVDENDQVRVMGRVLPTPDSFEIQGEVVQALGDVDKELYDRVIRQTA